MSQAGDRGPRDRREHAAAQVMAACVSGLGVAGSVLCVDDEVGAVASALERTGAEVARWWRRAAPGVHASPWPPDGSFAAASLWLPRGRQAFEMALHAAASRLEPGGRVWVYGANDAGIRSAGGPLGSLFEAVRSVEARRHSRVWEGSRRRRDVPLRAGLEQWRTRFAVELRGTRVELVTYPGVFAHGRIDEGTRRLLEALPALRPGDRVLDFGCGTGVVAKAIRIRCPGAELDLLDVDALAVQAARENLPGVRVHLGEGWSALDPSRRFDLVVSNPPLHRGKDRDLRALLELVEGARQRLEPRGRLLLVLPRDLPCQRWLEPRFDSVERVHESRRFRVWSASRPHRNRRAPSDGTGAAWCGPG